MVVPYSISNAKKKIPLPVLKRGRGIFFACFDLKKGGLIRRYSSPGSTAASHT
jgi:hypothetical protein